MPRRLVTRNEVAQLAGVSPGAVSFVLNNRPGHRIPERTRARIHAAAERLGYRPHSMARALASGKTRNIAVIIRQFHNPFLHKYLVAVLDRIWERSHGEGYRVVLEQSAPGRLVGELALEHFVDGCLLVAPDSQADRAFEALLDAEFPIVCAGGRPDVARPLNYVDIDNRLVGTMAARRIAEAGHRRVALIAGPLEQSIVARERFDAWRAALAEFEIAVPEERIFAGDWKIETGRAAAAEFDRRGVSFTAALAASDAIAAGAMEAWAARGRSVPGDVSIVGVDGGRVVDGRLISSVAQTPEDVGTAAAERLLACIRQPGMPPATVYVPVTMLEGQTVAPPRA